MSDSPVPTRYTFGFVMRSLPAGAIDVLEIGCGAGELAAMLGSSGLNVDALDSDEACVAEARERHVDAELGSWPTDVRRKYDSVLFTRSLHHIHDLEGAISAAVAALRPGGRVIVEDFRSEGGSERSRRWFRALVAKMNAASAFADGFAVTAALGKTETVDHEHPLHSSMAIAETLRTFGPVEAEDAAYYFRYLEADLASEAASQSLLDQELSLISSGAIDALGKRYVLAPWQ